MVKFCTCISYEKSCNLSGLKTLIFRKQAYYLHNFEESYVEQEAHGP